MGKEPVNIQRLVRENQRFSDAVAHAHDITRATNNAAWFTRDATVLQNNLTTATKDFAVPDSYIIERQKVKPRDQIAQELQVRNSNLETYVHAMLAECMFIVRVGMPSFSWHTHHLRSAQPDNTQASKTIFLSAAHLPMVQLVTDTAQLLQFYSAITTLSDVQSGNRVVLALRQEKLRALLQREHQQQEAELNAMGLAFDKHRD